ncbi:hypothetical protein [Acidipropionibacterium timonense]|uniref:hypothetical protein n=1 Tax=Acidipropionibacterium timonense TaxID=2161818 RepID=UPI0010324455|nr:hypothetical protein [Acidipropionibacterium timonense]
MAPEEYWTSRYVDTVGFSQTPSRIIAFDAAASGLSTSAYAGTGQGSYADPYRRTGEQAPTVPGVSIKDVFVFDALPGNTITLRYSNLYYGYQFVALAGIRFQAPCA